MSDDLSDDAGKLMDCDPASLCIGLTTDAGPGGVEKLALRCAELEAAHKHPIVACNAAVYWQTLRTIGLKDPVAGFGALLAG